LQKHTKKNAKIGFKESEFNLHRSPKRLDLCEPSNGKSKPKSSRLKKYYFLKPYEQFKPIATISKPTNKTKKN